MASNAEFGRFGSLLLAIIGMMLILSWAAEGGHTGPFTSIASTVILVGGVYAVSGRRDHIAIGLAIALPALLSRWALEVLATPWLFATNLALTALFLFLITGFLLDTVRRREHVDLDTILGGVCVYFLFVITFMYLHGLVEHLSPDSYRLGGAHLADVARGTRTFVEFFYFSMVTITTLGYGDMVPRGGVARLLCGLEAIFGQLFVAIFIARLVSLYTVHQASDSGSGSGDA